MLVTNALELGAAIREARETAGMTQRELADALGVVRQTVMNLERGKGTASVKLLLRAAAVLAIQIDMSGRTLLDPDNIDPDSTDERDGPMGAPDLDDVLQRAFDGHSSHSREQD